MNTPTPSENRRGFLKALGAGTATVLGASQLLRPADAAAAIVSDTQFATRSAIVRAGVEPAFLVKDFDGGYPFAEVIEDDSGAVVSKSIGVPRYKDLQFALNANLPTGARSLVQKFLSRSDTPIDGEVSYLRVGVEAGSLKYQEGILTEFTIPALTMRHSEAVACSCKMSFESSKRFAGNGLAPTIPVAGKGGVASSTKFRLTVQGLPVFLNTLEIAPITITRPVVSRGAGGVVVGPMGVTDLIATVPEKGAKALYDLLENNLDGTPAPEINATLELLSADLSKALITFELLKLNLWWLAMEDDGSITSGESATRETPIGKITAKMYCEEVRIKA